MSYARLRLALPADATLQSPSMYTLHCTKKLLDRMNAEAATGMTVPTTALGNWYATVLFWRPQLALLVSERGRYCRC